MNTAAEMLALTDDEWGDLEHICWAYCAKTDWVRGATVQAAMMRADMERDMPAELAAIKRRRALAARVISEATGVPMPRWAALANGDEANA